MFCLEIKFKWRKINSTSEWRESTESSTARVLRHIHRSNGEWAAKFSLAIKLPIFGRRTPYHVVFTVNEDVAKYDAENLSVTSSVEKSEHNLRESAWKSYRLRHNHDNLVFFKHFILTLNAVVWYFDCRAKKISASFTKWNVLFTRTLALWQLQCRYVRILRYNVFETKIMWDTLYCRHLKIDESQTTKIYIFAIFQRTSHFAFVYITPKHTGIFTKSLTWRWSAEENCFDRMKWYICTVPPYPLDRGRWTKICRKKYVFFLFVFLFSWINRGIVPGMDRALHI